ncbi:hypothetical protein AAFF_G00181070 [Aldrovandia affinis]|uniref:Protein Dok-7 n=1 Tax=Aldrovandia affinis TaxID=143900 RepID=A0AAD7WVS6_9TELE|nr:hypothetical protein AAFF_G00181070 [Aldrovandia affinis]
MTDTVVVEGQVKFRDGKKWKSRWVVLRKPSPVADCLLLLAYKDKADKTKGHRERCSITLEDICGLEPVLSYEGATYTLAILCLTQAVIVGFESRDALVAWDARIRYSLGEVHRFSVGILPGTKLESGPATLHLCNNLLGIARDHPPVIIGQWKLSDLRRYGAVPNGFVFEGGTRCGYWAGVFFLSCGEGEQISFLFDCIVRGISPTRGPFGLRQPPPDPNVDPAYAEERLNLEAQQLEKRLSMLSHCSSRQSSTASTYSYGTSVAGDARSISSSSSEASHSDTSIGSRLTMWAEPVTIPVPAEPLGPPAAKSALRAEEKLYAAVAGGAGPPTKPPRSRRLQEIGRQSSSDSGIATGSHSSYSGSFSSYAGSIDTSQGDEFGSLLSLPPSLAPDQSPCTCPPADPAQGPGSEYQIPALLKHLYDTPRSLFLGPPPKDLASLPSPKGGGDGRLGEGALGGGAGSDPIPPQWPVPQRQGQALDSRSSEAAPSAGGAADPCEICSPQSGMTSSLFAACPICGGLKGTTLTHSGVLPMPAIPGVETVEPWQCRPISRVEVQGYENLWNTKATVAEDPPAATCLHGNRPWEAFLSTNGRDPLWGNLHQKHQNPLGLFLRFHGQQRSARRQGTNAGGRQDYEPTASAFRCGLLAGPHWIRRSSKVVACARHGGFSVKRNDSEGGVNSQVSATKTSTLPFGHESSPEQACDTLSRRGTCPPPGPGVQTPARKENGSGPEETDERRDGSRSGEGRLCQEVSGHSRKEDDKTPKRKEDRGKADVGYEIMEGRAAEKTSEAEERGQGLELTGGRGQQKVFSEAEGAVSASGSSSTLKVHRQSSVTDPKGSYELMASTADTPKRFEPGPGEYGGVFVFPPEASSATERSRSDGATYVNIPISPTSKKQLHYMELELQEPGSGVRGNAIQLHRHRGGSTKYAQIDIAATETAHRVGTQHALGREERLQELEQKRKGVQ